EGGKLPQRFTTLAINFLPALCEPVFFVDAHESHSAVTADCMNYHAGSNAIRDNGPHIGFQEAESKHAERRLAGTPRRLAATSGRRSGSRRYPLRKGNSLRLLPPSAGQGSNP